MTDSGLMVAVSIVMYATDHPIAGSIALILAFLAANE